MAFNFQCNADFSGPDVRKFLNDRANLIYTSPAPGTDDPDLVLVPGTAAQKPLGPFLDVDKNPLTELVGEVACRFDVFERRSLISSSIKAVPVSYDVTVQLYAQLFVRKGDDSIISDMQAILATFNPQTQSADEIADQLATRAMNPIKRDQYLVSVFYVITKANGGTLKQAKPADWEASKTGQCGNTELNSKSKIDDADMCQTLQNGEYRTVVTELGPEVMPPVATRDPVREVEATDPHDPATVNKVYEGVVVLNGPADCGMLTREDPIKIADIFSYPQIKIDWVTATFKIGCVHITLTYPVLRYRMATIVLYALLAHAPLNFDEYTKKVVVEVIVISAVFAAIVFYATESFTVAYETFKGAMTSGLKKIFGNMIKCLLPEIVAITQTGDWQ